MSLFYSVCKVFLFFILVSTKVSGEDRGYFWHISDTHVDQNYSRTGNPRRLCHSEGGDFPDNGLYGNFLCDSPLYLVNATIWSMRDLHPSPDFIIWTGDNLPHSIAHADPDWEVTFEAIRNTTQALVKEFPGIPIFPSIGNHDTFPPNLLPANETSPSIYRGYLEEGGWGALLGPDERVTFLQGGFYTRVLRPGLRIVSVNTILWYFSNHLTTQIPDPGNQFTWLDTVLKNSSAASEKVYIIGHVPPGFYNRVWPGELSTPTFHPQHLQRYMQMLLKYSNIITAQLYGHLHMDMFQVYDYDTGVFKGSSLLASSVSPWHEADKYNSSLPVNPSVRLIHFSLTDNTLLDYDQYYLDLETANNINKTYEENNRLYEHLYTFTEYYGVPNLSTQSLVRAYEMLKRNESVYEGFYNFLTAGKISFNCDKSCKIAQLCSSCSSVNDYHSCMNATNSLGCPTPKPNKNRKNIFWYIFVPVLIMLISITLFLLYTKLWKSKKENYDSFSSSF